VHRSEIFPLMSVTISWQEKQVLCTAKLGLANCKRSQFRNGSAHPTGRSRSGDCYTWSMILDVETSP
jgi:hypothetical protein